MNPIPFPRFPPLLVDWGLGAFPFFVALGTVTTITLLVLLRKRRKLEVRELAALVLVVAGAATLGAHLVELLLYRPERLATEGLGLLLASGDGLASSGALLGGAIGLFVLAGRLERPFGELADSVCESLPFGWAIGRVGCFFVHDHPGLELDVFPAVAYPGGARLDLGLMEAILLVLLGLLALGIGRQRRDHGATAIAVLGSYALGRFLLDFARIDCAGARDLSAQLAAVVADPRYLGLTPAQWFCLALLAFLLVQRMRRKRSSRLKAR